MATPVRATAELRPLSGAVGAEVINLDVTTLDDGAWVLDALAKHQLLAVRGQRLDAAALSRFAALLGERVVYPFSGALADDPYVAPIVHEPGDTEVFGGIWHSDSSYLERPPGLTVLYAVELPKRGGDTLYADMYTVYEQLSDGLKGTLEGLIGVFSADLVHSTDGEFAAAAGADRNRLAPEASLVAEHPVVRTHPTTGRKALYVSLAHTREFKGMSRAESLPLLSYLSEQTRRPEVGSRLEWQEGTLAIWDNRCLQHYPLNDYPDERREMWRVIIAGEVPR